ncbi:zinc finger CCCH domain-containing protein 17-like [Hordeum vulgare subsp. vulgare]|uniref:C3H1-type domain-containing protein n=1 Tax=Hordeum vulgare subsp. vulgare TaxID=112509 RepID=A0A8I6XI53_HORVV|nr:zinc finger CCCH domain-containing protein 17-like [Hordeum vulgare subsp. vulgare]
MAAVQRRQPLPPASHKLRRGEPACSGTAPPPVCRYWKSGHCVRKPCRFLHADPAQAPPPSVVVAKKRSNTWVNTSSKIAKPSAATDGGEAAVPPVPPTTTKPSPATNVVGAAVPPVPPTKPDQPPVRVQEQPVGGVWCVGDGIRGVARLEGHSKAVTGVAVPEGSGKLFSGSLDGTVRAWDCATGQCVRVAPVQEGEVGRLIAMGPWVLLGVRGAVRALHAGSGNELRLRLPAAAAQVTALLAEDDERLFAGAEDGAIYMWRLDRERQRFDEVAALAGHGGHAVASLAQGKGALYSGAADGGIRVWDLETRRCVCSFAGHASIVTALLCWDRFLLSSSVDGTVKAWRSKPDHGDVDPELEVHYTHREEGERVVAMDGTHDAGKKPVLLVSRGDGVVRVYDLPSFKPRGQIRCNGEVTAMSLRTPGVAFTGDASGEVRVVKWTPAAAS